MKFDQLSPEYAKLWASMYVHTGWQTAVDATAHKILANKDRYVAVSDMTRVPWYVIGVIHQMESGCNFGCHLHNGDPLAERTKQVPKNRPASGVGPFTWEASACDALLLKKLNTVQVWTIERICYEFERYNGWGYRNYHPTTLTPYLWSGTAHYARGKYIADGKWSPDAVSRQSGAMPLLKRLTELDTTINIALSDPGPIVEERAPAETVQDSFKKAEETQTSKTAVAIGTSVAVGAGTQAINSLPASVPIVPDVMTVPPVPAPLQETVSNAQSWQFLGDTAWSFKTWATAQPLLAGALVIGLAVYWFWPKREAG